jgi:hypothetical protein
MFSNKYLNYVIFYWHSALTIHVPSLIRAQLLLFLKLNFTSTQKVLHLNHCTHRRV